jgi:hypothetical protein
MSEGHGKLHVRPAPAKAPPARTSSPAAPAKEAGRPLEPPVRGDMERAFGHDFSRVRVHAGPEAAGVAHGLGAAAFTRGRDLYFGAGRYAPDSAPGRRLLAHELAHVVQQDAGGGADATGPARVVPPWHPSERAASAAARRAGEGGAPGPATASAAELARSAAAPKGAVVQRETPGAAEASPDAPLAAPQGGPRERFTDPRLRFSPEVAQKILSERAAPLRDWLEANTDSLKLLSGAQIVARVRTLSVVGPDFADIEILKEVGAWAARHHHEGASLLPEPAKAQAPPPPGDSELLGAAAAGFSAAKDGVGIVRPGAGRAVISMEGATAGLALRRVGELSATLEPGGVELELEGKKTGRAKKPKWKANASLSWDGDVGVSVTAGELHFKASIDDKRWSASLSFPGDSPLTFISELTRIFSAGEAGMRGIVAAVEDFDDLSEIPDVAAAVKPHLAPVEAAVSAAKAIAKVVPRRVNVGITASGPVDTPGTPSASGGAEPEGVKLVGTVTIIFGRPRRRRRPKQAR